MKKTFNGALVVMQLIAVCALISFTGCEGPEGPIGPAGTAGVSGTGDCGTCYDVSTSILAKQIQWEESLHGSGGAYVRGSSASCAPCHSSEGFSMKVAGMEVTGSDDPTPVNCRTCHDIHTNYDITDYALATTAPVELTGSMPSTMTVDIGKGNLCANCHQTRNRSSYGLEVGGPDVTITSSHYGPHHGVQTNCLVGESAFELPGTLAYTNSAHATAVSDGCVTCHLSSHTFEASEDACETCHADIDGFDYRGVQTEIKGLVVELAALLYADGLIEHAEPDEDGAYHNLKKTTTSAKAGALFNFIWVANEDGSNGIHNTKYTRAMLQNSIEAF